MRIAFSGSRDLSKVEFLRCESVGAYYGSAIAAAGGGTMISGGADGADLAFFMGAGALGVADLTLEVWLPWDKYRARNLMGYEHLGYAHQATPELQQVAMWCHPAWHALTGPVRQLLTRNALIVAGADLLVAHPRTTKRGWGGTGHAIRCAEYLRVPVWLCNFELQRYCQIGEC